MRRLQVGDVIERVHDQAGGGSERPGERATVVRVDPGFAALCATVAGPSGRQHDVFHSDVLGCDGAIEKWRGEAPPWRLL